MLTNGKLEAVFSSVVGKPAWMVRLGHGSFLTFEFGAPILRRRDPTARFKRRVMIVRGEWHLWIYCCLWEVRDGSTLIADSSSDRATMSNAARFLDGQILDSVTYSNDTMRCRFEFDLGGVMEAWLDGDDPSEQWLLYHKEDDVCILNASNELEFSPYNGAANSGV